MSDNGLGCVWIGGIMAMVILLAALTFGAPLINSGGLSWDNSAAIARFNAKVEVDRQRRNYQAHRIRQLARHGSAGRHCCRCRRRRQCHRLSNATQRDSLGSTPASPQLSIASLQRRRNITIMKLYIMR